MENRNTQIYRFTSNPGVVHKKTVQNNVPEGIPKKQFINHDFSSVDVINSFIPLFNEGTIRFGVRYEVNIEPGNVKYGYLVNEESEIVKYVYPVNEESELYYKYKVSSIVIEIEKKDLHLYKDFVQTLDKRAREKVTSAHKQAIKLKRAIAVGVTAVAMSAIILVTWVTVKNSKDLEKSSYTPTPTQSLTFDDDKTPSQNYAQMYENNRNFEEAQRQAQQEEHQQAQEEAKRHVKALGGY